MPDYDFHCEDCDRRLLLRWRRIADYAAATPVCPHCGSDALTRLIGAVGVARGGRDYASMSSGDMLSVLEGEDPGEMQELQRQVYEGADQE
ncbi:MAG: hypothetical protein OXP68_06540 [Anaerolineaceae bacterium]|nr:hypothetical protein [Anaerolineaceae bacterium]MDE0610708.1 hypothetical protein [Anaerolineaceae bacterium]